MKKEFETGCADYQPIATSGRGLEGGRFGQFQSCPETIGQRDAVARVAADEKTAVGLFTGGHGGEMPVVAEIVLRDGVRPERLALENRFSGHTEQILQVAAD